MIPYALTHKILPVEPNLYWYAFTDYGIHSFLFTFLIFGLSDELFLRLGLYDRVEEGFEFKGKIDFEDDNDLICEPF